MNLLTKILPKFLQDNIPQATADVARQIAARVDGATSVDAIRAALKTIPVDPDIAELFRQDPAAKLDDAAMKKAWQFYGDLCRACWRARHPDWREDRIFAEDMFFDGQFPPADAGRFAKEALASPAIPFRVEDSAPGYHHNYSTVVPLVDT